MPKIKDLPKVDMPREKLWKYGPRKLRDHELLAIVLGSGIEGMNVIELSKNILRRVRSIGIGTVILDDLLKEKGLGKAKAASLIALFELGRRLCSETISEILSPRDIWNLCSDILQSKKEHCVAFYLDTQNIVIERQIVSIGILNASLVHPREVFEPAVALHAAGVIVAHNHPSGNLQPSPDDIDVTKRLHSAGNILGIALLDHIIVSKQGFVSLKERGMIA